MKNSWPHRQRNEVQTPDKILLAAEREPYEKALRSALSLLRVLANYERDCGGGYYEISTGKVDYPLMVEHMSRQAKLMGAKIIRDLKREGIPDPTELKDEQ